MTCTKIRAGFVNLGKKQITLCRQGSQSTIQKNMFWEKSFIIGTRRTKVAKRDWIYKLYFLNFKMFYLCRKYNLLYLFNFYQRYVSFHIVILFYSSFIVSLRVIYSYESEDNVPRLTYSPKKHPRE